MEPFNDERWVMDREEINGTVYASLERSPVDHSYIRMIIDLFGMIRLKVDLGDRIEQRAYTKYDKKYIESNTREIHEWIFMDENQHYVIEEQVLSVKDYLPLLPQRADECHPGIFHFYMVHGLKPFGVVEPRLKIFPKKTVSGLECLSYKNALIKGVANHQGDVFTSCIDSTL